MKLVVRVLTIVLTFAVLLSVSTGCGEKKKKTTQERRINVEVKSALKKSLRPSVKTIGTLKCYDRVKVSSEIDGIIKNILVREGDFVRKGSLLAIVDDKDIKLEVERAEAALSQAEASLANTKLEYERKKALFEDKLVTAQQFDDVAARLSIAEAELKKARSALLTARQKLQKTSILSPITGVIEEKKVSSGDYVRAAMEIFSVIQINPIKIEFTVPEKEISALKTGQDVVFTVDAFPEKQFRAKVKVIYPSLDEAARTLRAEAEAQNPEGILKPGLFAQVLLYKDKERDVVVVPSTALLYEGQDIKAYVIKGDTAEERHLRTGSTVRISETNESSEIEFTEVLEGIAEGEQVVVVGQQNLYNGVKVNVSR